MKYVAVDATFHARAELMEEFKVGKHVDWDPDYEISFWKEKDAELAEAVGEDEATGNPLTLRVESPRISKPVHGEVGPNVATHDEGMAKEPSGEHEETIYYLLLLM